MMAKIKIPWSWLKGRFTQDIIIKYPELIAPNIIRKILCIAKFPQGLVMPHPNFIPNIRGITNTMVIMVTFTCESKMPITPSGGFTP